MLDAFEKLKARGSATHSDILVAQALPEKVIGAGKLIRSVVASQPWVSVLLAMLTGAVVMALVRNRLKTRPGVSGFGKYRFGQTLTRKS